MQDCSSKQLHLTFRKGHVPAAFSKGDEGLEVCILCDDRVLDLCEYRQGSARPRYKGGGARGRGRGRGRRGRGRNTDAKMTFHGF
jgi:DNA topoisomerase III